MFNGVKLMKIGYYLLKMEYNNIVKLIKLMSNEVFVVYVHVMEEKVVKRMLRVEGILTTIMYPGAVPEENVLIVIRGTFVNLPEHSVCMAMKQILYV